MMIARVVNGAVIERRHMQMSDVPEHKRYLWTPVIVDGEGPIESIAVESDVVRITLSAAPQAPDVIAELQRKIDDQQEAQLRLERSIALGFQCVDAAGDRLPTVAKYPDLAAALGLSDQDAPAVWHAKIEALKSP